MRESEQVKDAALSQAEITLTSFQLEEAERVLAVANPEIWTPRELLFRLAGTIGLTLRLEGKEQKKYDAHSSL